MSIIDAKSSSRVIMISPDKHGKYRFLSQGNWLHLTTELMREQKHIYHSQTNNNTRLTYAEKNILVIKDTQTHRHMNTHTLNKP